MASASDHPRPFADAWKFKHPSDLTFAQNILVLGNVLIPSTREFKYPQETGKLPVVLEWDQHIRWFPVFILPVVLRGLYMHFTGNTIPPVVMYGISNLFTFATMMLYMQHITSYAKKYGFLDNQSSRDSVPESMAHKVFGSLITAVFIRPLVVFLLAYDENKAPSLDLWLPFQLFVFTAISDFIYYWVHRATHEVPLFWKYHQRHHTTKHPTPYLAAFADEPQEVFDAIGSPIIAFMLFPIGFDALYIWSIYMITSEVLGHSGLRLYISGVLVSYTM